MTKKDLKTGMRVELRDGSLGMVVENLDGNQFCIVGKGVWFASSQDYDDNLLILSEHNANGLDVMKVYDIPENPQYYICLGCENVLTWIRSEPKKMTIVEIERTLGYEIEIVK